MKSYTGSSQCIGFLYVLFIWFSQRNKYNFFYLCVVTLFIMWLNCKNKTKKQLKKKKKSKSTWEKRQAKIPNRKPSCDESKISVLHSDLGASMPEWGGRNPYSGVTSWYWRTEKSDLWLRWHHQAAWCEWCKATSPEDSASALQMLYLPCFRISVAWSCAPQAIGAKKIKSGSTFSGFVTSKRNLVCMLWLHSEWWWFKNGLKHKASTDEWESAAVISTYENRITKLSQNCMEAWFGRFLMVFMNKKVRIDLSYMR